MQGDIVRVSRYLTRVMAPRFFALPSDELERHVEACVVLLFVGLDAATTAAVLGAMQEERGVNYAVSDTQFRLLMRDYSCNAKDPLD